jgi:hypothetical protein
LQREYLKTAYWFILLSQWEGAISPDLATGIFKDSPLVYLLSQWEVAISPDFALGGW